MTNEVTQEKDVCLSNFFLTTTSDDSYSNSVTRESALDCEKGMIPVIQNQDTHAEVEIKVDDKEEEMLSAEAVTSFQDGQEVQLDDGTTALIFHQSKETFPQELMQPVQLNDGTTAYIYRPHPEQLENIADEDVQTDALNDDTIIISTNFPSSVAHATEIKSRSMQVFQCDQGDCKKVYSTAHHLKVHKRTHTGEKPFVCKWKDCNKVFTTSYALKSHLRVHTGEKPYPCPERSCIKAFKTSGDLQKHIRTHTGVKPFKCPFEGCGKAFTTSNICKVHIRTHTGERPYKCTHPRCTKSFSNITNYKNHVRIHTGEKPYVCNVDTCGKQFTEYSSLYKHQVVHSDDKPYTCCFCLKTFRQTSTLVIHKRKMHSDKIGMCNGGSVVDEDFSPDHASTVHSLDRTGKLKDANISFQHDSTRQNPASSSCGSAVVVVPVESITSSCILVNNTQDSQFTILTNNGDSQQQLEQLLVTQDGIVEPITLSVTGQSEDSPHLESSSNSLRTELQNFSTSIHKTSGDETQYVNDTPATTLCKLPSTTAGMTDPLKVSGEASCADTSDLWLNCSNSSEKHSTKDINEENFTYATLQIDGTNYLVQFAKPPKTTACDCIAVTSDKSEVDPERLELVSTVQERNLEASPVKTYTAKIGTDLIASKSSSQEKAENLNCLSSGVVNSLFTVTSTTSSNTILPLDDSNSPICSPNATKTCHKSEYRKILPARNAANLKDKTGRITVILPGSSAKGSTITKRRYLLPKQKPFMNAP